MLDENVVVRDLARFLLEFFDTIIYVFPCHSPITSNGARICILPTFGFIVHNERTAYINNAGSASHKARISK